MPIPSFSSIKGDTTEELINAIERQRKEMNWLLSSLDTSNIKELNANVVNTGILNANNVKVKSDLDKGFIELYQGLTINNGTKDTFIVDLEGNVVMDGNHLVTNNGLPLFQSYTNDNGGVTLIYDINGNLNAKIGSEEGTGGNRGGTFILYDDSQTEPRIEMGISKNSGSGVIIMRDSVGRPKIHFASDNDGTEDSLSAPIMGILNDSGSFQTYFTETKGYINSDLVATQPWVEGKGYTTFSGSGISGSFTTSDGKTVDVSDGLITSIA